MTIGKREKEHQREPTSSSGAESDRYKWVALSNTTIGMLMVTIDSSIVLIAMPDIFRGIKLNPLTPGNTSYLLWMMLSYMITTAVLVVSFGRVGDIFGRVRMYNLGFAIFTIFSALLSIVWMQGSAAALYLIIIRVFQGIGGAFLFANSSAILTDAFPANQRGMALGVNSVAAIAGSFIGLVLGGILGPINWRLVFLVSVPVGLIGTIWAYLMLEERGIRRRARIDWWGNLTFAIGLVAVLYGITYGILPYGGHSMGWTSPKVLGSLVGGVVFLVLFGWVETRVASPMFHMDLFRIRAFAAGNVASLLSSLGRGGMMFILVIWLQGIWLPQHGYSFERTPLWAGIYMLPMTFGFLVAGPVSGILSDRFGARPFATGGMVGAALTFVLLELLPINFNYIWFALLIFLNGVAMGVFAAPNRAGIMNALPREQRGAGSGMVATFQNSAMVLSIGIFFSLIILGLTATLPNAMMKGLVAQGVPSAAAEQIAHLPAVGSLFAAFLGSNPMQSLLGPAVLGQLPAGKAAYLTGRSFFPQLISPAFGTGLHEAFTFAAVICLIAAGASWLRGGQYVYQDVSVPEFPATAGDPMAAAGSEEAQSDALTGAPSDDRREAGKRAQTGVRRPSASDSAGDGGSAREQE